MRIFLTLLFLFLPLIAAAQDRSRAILVMDGSGSMWGQIEGEAKITIAQGVVGELLGTLPADMDLGLTVYGHRRKGDCTDIETIVQPGAQTQGAITQAVNGIKPKGKTPMTDAIREAAMALRFTEEKATVILVSDGIETCEPDPCAAARALEEAGIDFTAHVIGFDVTDTEALRQMQCLADETGGTFLSASNAAELADAMTTVVAAAPEPEPQPVEIIFRATDGENGPLINDPLVWDLSRDAKPLLDTVNAQGFVVALKPGEYRIEVLRPTDEATGEAIFGVGQVGKTVTIALPEFRPAATVQAADSAPAGSIIPVRWTGPNTTGDYVSVAAIGDSGYENYTYTQEGSPLDLTMPATPGAYELRYILQDGSKVLAAQPITVTEVTATVVAESALPAGGKATVSWAGPNYPQDYIAVSKPGADGYVTYTYTRDGSPLEVQLPAEPGAYELRYVMRQKTRVLATTPINVAMVSATVTPPVTLQAGARAKIEWTGPNAAQDYIAVFPVGSDRYSAYAYTRDGSPVDLQLPAEPGAYEIAYVQRQDKKKLAIVAVTVAPVTASVKALGPLRAGGGVQVEWTGPDNPQDYIAIFPQGETQYASYTYTKEGSPLTLRLPSEPGAYEIAYVLREGKTKLSSAAVTLEAVSASVSVPDTLPAGSTAQITWDGPNDPQDYIAIFPAGSNSYAFYAYTKDGSPAALRIPSTPGAYEVGYVQRQGKNVLTRVAVNVTPVSATVTPPAALAAGTVAQVTWEGPNDPRDYIAVFNRGEDRHLRYIYTSKGNPAQLTLPNEPGDYDIGYVQDVGRNILTRVPVTIE